jgi:hypothetical protein
MSSNILKLESICKTFITKRVQTSFFYVPKSSFEKTEQFDT